MTGTRRWRSWSIRARLLLAFTLVGCVVIGSAVAGLAASAGSSTAIRGVTGGELPLQRASTRMHTSGADSIANVRGFVISGDNGLREAFNVSWAGYGEAVEQARRICPVKPGACNLVERQDAAMQQWHRQYAVPALTRRQSRADAAASYQASRALAQRADAANAELTAAIDRGLDAAARAADVRRRTALWLLAAGTVLAALGLLALAWWTLRSIVPPLSTMRSVLLRLEAGDLSARAPERGPSELRAVAQSLNQLAEQSARLRDAELGRAQVRQLTRELDRRMRRHLHAEAVAEEMVGGLGAISHSDRVHVRFVDEGRMGPIAAQWTTSGLPPLKPGPPLATDPLESASAVATRGHTALLIADVQDEHFPQALGGVGSLLVAPVLVGSECVGVLICARRTGTGPYDAAEASVIEAVAGDFGRAVNHARLFEQQNSVVGQLRALDRTKSDFLSTISHELRTPLTSIAGSVEMMRDGDAGELQPMQAQMLEIVGRNTQRLRDLIEDVLTISRVESGAIRSERLPIALAGIVDHAVTSLRPQADSGGVSIEVYPISPDAIVLGDPSQIDRMVLNLVANAVKFTPRRGRVTVSAEVAGTSVVLRVQDTGIGIPSAEVGSLFTRFFRASNATQRQIPGTGLGLAIIGGIVTAHRGRVEVDSIEGRGTTFTVTVPVWDAEDTAAARPSSAMRL